MADEAPSTNGNQAIGKVTKHVVGTDWESYTEQPDRKALLLTNRPAETYQPGGC